MVRRGFIRNLMALLSTALSGMELMAQAAKDSHAAESDPFEWMMQKFAPLHSTYRNMASRL